MTIRAMTCGCKFWDDGEEDIEDNTQVSWCEQHIVKDKGRIVK